jgi:uncharacterized protein YecE (DUF72 family)
MTLDAASPGRIHIGISGWRYKGWRGVFYPEKLPQRRELEFASRKFGTIELNGSFYSLQRPQSFLRWHAETPPDFTFAIKGSRYITHMLRLRNVEGPLANFFAQGLLHLGAKLGPILWLTADFVYCRLHGSEQLYASGYEAGALDVWARRVVAWARGEEVTDGRRASARDAAKRKRRDVFVYFDNDMKVRAPFDAEQLRIRVNGLLAGTGP